MSYKKLYEMLPYLLIVLLIVIFFLGCESDSDFSIIVHNKLDTVVSLYLDDVEYAQIPAGSNFTIDKIKSGKHILDAKTYGYKPIRKEINVNSDVEWVINK